MEMQLKRLCRNVVFQQLHAQPGQSPPPLEVLRRYSHTTMPVRKELVEQAMRVGWRWDLKLTAQYSDGVVLTASLKVAGKFEELPGHVAVLEQRLPVEGVVSYGWQAVIIDLAVNTAIGD